MDLDRLDGWMNYMTGHGTTRDKMEYSYFGSSNLLTDDQLDDLYTTGEMVARICEAFPEQFFKKDFDIKIRVNGQVDNVLSSEIKSQLVYDLDVKDKLKECFIWDNVFGGCGLYLGTEDSGELNEELNEKSIRSLEYLNVIDKRDLNPISFYRNANNKRYGDFELFNVTSYFDANLTHASRFLIFKGLKVSSRKRDLLNGFGLSFIQRCYQPLRAYGINFKSIDNLLSDANQGVFKFKNYMSLIANGDFTKIQNRLAAMDMQRSTARALVVDADFEDFERKSFSWQGIDKPMMLSMLRLSAVTNIPVSILMGREPAGLNATGESDHTIFYDKSMSDQQYKVAPNIRYLSKLLCISRNRKPDNIDVEFEPLIELSNKDKAELYLKVAQADKIYIDEGVLTEEEVLESRFTKDGYSLETNPDFEARDRLRKAEEGIEESELVESEANVMDALNGAQMKSIVDIVGLIDAPEGGITSNQAKGILKVSIPGLTDKQLNEIVKK